MLLTLPTEMLTRILKYLSYKDLKSACLVCRKLNTLSSQPSLWSRLPLVLSYNILSVIPMSRLSSLSHLHLIGMALTDTDLVCLNRVNLSYLCLDKCNLSNLSGHLLARCLSKLLVFKLIVHFEFKQEERFSSDQLLQIFEKLSEHKKLKTLEMSFCDLSSIPCPTLAMVITNLNKAELHWCMLLEDQVMAIFNSLYSQPVTLKQLDIGYNNISYVPPTILARVVCKMERVNIYNIRHTLHRQQLMELLREISRTDNLSELVLGGNIMEEIPDDDLATAVSRLAMLNLDHCDLTESQAVAVVTAACESGQLRGLHLSGNILTHVATDLLVKCVSRLEMLSVSLAHLSQVQVEHMVKAMSTSSCNIRHLDISHNDLSQVDPAELAIAVNNLEKVVLHNTFISEYQAIKILKHVITQTELKELNIGGDLRTIPPDIIAQSFNKLQCVTLHTEKTLLSSKAEKELLRMLGEKSCLKKLDLRCRDLSRVDDDDIARAVNNLTEVNIMETNLSSSQIQNIFVRLCDKSSLKYLDIRGCDIRILSEATFKLAKQKCHFILHDFDVQLKKKVKREKIFGNLRLS